MKRRRDNFFARNFFPEISDTLTHVHMHIIIKNRLYKTKEHILPRSKIRRKICAEPNNKTLIPIISDGTYVVLSMDEVEALRLCDYEQFDQQTAAEMMGISRGTLQRILYAARKLTAQALSCGCGIKIDGGDYELAPRERSSCKNSCKICKKKHQQSEENS